jgi:hypothetical protein
MHVQEASRALESDDSVEALSRLVKRALRDQTREDVLANLEALRILARDRGRTDLEDEILDVMDFVTGWCAPSARLS